MIRTNPERSRLLGFRASLSAAIIAAQQANAMQADTTCLDAAKVAAAETGVPERLLVAITLTETQQSGTAWPWSINHAGDGAWFPDRPSAEAAARDLVDEGESIDIGCFQLNTHWHGDAFPSVEAMFDPTGNARHAAAFLLRLYAETGDWPAAVAAYHSRDPDRGESYLHRVGTMLASLETGEPTLPSRQNRFPLLAAGSPGSAGSVVPRLEGGSPLIGAP